MAKVYVRLVVDEDELARWGAEARRHNLPVQDWAVRAIRYLFETEAPGGRARLGRAPRLASQVVACAECGRQLPPGVTPRRLYCSDVCWVIAWRERRREGG